MNFGPNPIVVCDRDYFPLLFSLREKHPEWSFKLLDPEEVIDRASFRYQDNVIPLLLPLGMDYVKAKKYLRLFRLAPEDPHLAFIASALPETAKEVDPLGTYELKRATVYLLEMPEDIELHALLKGKVGDLQDLTFEDLGVEEKLDEATIKNIRIFQNKYEQYAYVFAQLRERLLKKEIDPFSVRIHVKDEGDAFYLRTIGSLFGIATNIRLSSSLAERHDVAELLATLHRRGSLALTDDEKKTEAGQFVDEANQAYGLPNLSFPLGYASLLEILQAKTVREDDEGVGVEANSRFLFTPNQEVYLTCFELGSFHNVFADDDVFDDATLKGMGINPSYVRTQLEKRKKWNYLRFHRFALISRVKEHLDDKIYDSQFMDEKGWKAQPAPSFMTPEGVFTTKAAKAFNMRVYDKSFVFSKQGEYRSYDSSFKGIRGYSFSKKRWGITNLEKYVNCPYAYYLGTVLPRAAYDIRPAYVGTMIHKALEHVYDANYDLETAIDLGKTEFLNRRASENEPALPYDEVLIELTAENLRRYVPLIRSQRDHAKIVASFNEEWVDWTYRDADGSCAFGGSVDNIVILKDESHNYYVVNDYKSGSEKFRAYEVFLGKSTQLPSYVNALQNGDFQRKHGGKFAGMGIKTVAFSSYKSAFEDDGFVSLANARKSLSSKGVFLVDTDFWRLGDDTAIRMKKPSKKNDPPQEVCKSSGEYFSCGAATFDASGAGSLSMVPGGRPYSLQQLLEDAQKATMATIRKIEAGEFPIAPTSSDLRVKPSGENITCRYCAFKDVCYHNLGRDKKDYSTIVAEYFRMKNTAPAAANEKEED